MADEDEKWFAAEDDQVALNLELATFVEAGSLQVPLQQYFVEADDPFRNPCGPW